MPTSQDRWRLLFENGLPSKRPPDACWNWQARCFQLPGGLPICHAAWQVAHGEPVPRGKVVTQACGNSCCVNPAHQVLRSPDTRGNPRTPKGPAKLTPDQVRQIRSAAKDGRKTKAQIADDYGVSPSAIASACNGEHWQDI